MENVSNSQSPKFPPFTLSHVMLPTLNPLITQPPPLPLPTVLYLSTVSDFRACGDFILSNGAYLKIERIKKIRNLYFHPSQQNRHSQKTGGKKNSSVCNSSPLPFPFTAASFTVLILLVPQLACFPRSRCISRFVKSVKMPVMNISTALSVFNMLFDQHKKKRVLIWRYRDQSISRRFIVHKLSGLSFISRSQKEINIYYSVNLLGSN